jgi:hypothetical protein
MNDIFVTKEATSVVETPLTTNQANNRFKG